MGLERYCDGDYVAREKPIFKDEERYDQRKVSL